MIEGTYSGDIVIEGRSADLKNTLEVVIFEANEQHGPAKATVSMASTSTFGEAPVHYRYGGAEHTDPLKSVIGILASGTYDANNIIGGGLVTPAILSLAGHADLTEAKVLHVKGIYTDGYTNQVITVELKRH